MNKQLKQYVWKALVAFLVPGVSSAVGQIETEISLPKKVFNKMKPDSVTYFSAFAGPSMGESDPVDQYGELDEGAINTWTQVSFGWKLTDETNFVFNPRFEINHNTIDPETETYAWDDPVMGVTTTWYKKGNFSFTGQFNSIIPALRTEGTIDEGLLFNPGGWQTLSYRLNSKWSVSSWLDARWQIFDRALTEEDDTLALMVAPMVTYAWSDKVSGTCFYQINGGGDESFRVKADDDESLNAMLSYSAGKRLTIEPILTVYRENEYDVSKANVSLWLSGAIF